MAGESELIDVVIADEQTQPGHDVRSSQAREFGVIAHARDGRAAGALVLEFRPGVVVLDLALPRRAELESAIEALDEVRPVRVIAIVRAIDQAQLFEALRVGAHGIILRSSGAASAIKSIREVASGRYCFPHDGLAILVQVLQDHIRKEPERSCKDYALTPRELEIISRITAGLSNRMVGMEFSISERTVKQHLTNIYNKVGVSNRVELAMFALKRQLVPGAYRDAVAPAPHRD